MKQNVLLIVELHNEEKKTRKRFADTLEESGWSTFQRSPNTFQRTFSREQRSDIEESVENQVREAAKKVHAPDWDAICAVSERAPVRFD